MKASDKREKASYCLHCKTRPCEEKGCPLGNQIPDFIEAVKEEEIEKAYEILSETTVLPGICGRICPHEKQCQGSCVRGIKGEPVSIGELEAFVFDEMMKQKRVVKQNKVKEHEKQEKNSHCRVAVIGGGPAGLTCAAFLAREGVRVTIYEKHDRLGGILSHGIPEFRLPREVIAQTIDNILALGIEVKLNQKLGEQFTLAEIKDKYDAIFLGIGANQSAKMGVEGENLAGVLGGNELLEYQNHPSYEGKTVAVIGGGNVAMDCSRTIKRLGAKEVKVIYRRAEEQMPAEKKEIAEAKEEGIEFLFQNNIVKIMGNDKVEKLELIKTKLVQKEGESRLVPVNVENSNYQMEVDYVIMALGSTIEEEVLTLGLTLNKWGNVLINENYQTSCEKIYAGGDLAGMKGTVAWAARSGREAAKKILEKILA